MYRRKARGSAAITIFNFDTGESDSVVSALPDLQYSQNSTVNVTVSV